jgi:prepilin-type N-terminal cleavage/methylation domain-containing protein
MRSRRGFTLLEILIAVCILGTSLVVVIGHVNHAVRLYRVARETIVATSLARARLDELTGTRDPLRERTEAGPVKEDTRFHYAISIREYQLPGFEKDDVKGLFRVEASIDWDHGVRRVRLVQILTNPDPEEAR